MAVRRSRGGPSVLRRPAYQLLFGSGTTPMRWWSACLWHALNPGPTSVVPLRKSHRGRRQSSHPSRNTGLTRRSSGAPTASRQARSGGTRYIVASPGLAPCRRRPLSSSLGQFRMHCLPAASRSSGRRALSRIPVSVACRAFGRQWNSLRSTERLKCVLSLGGSSLSWRAVRPSAACAPTSVRHRYFSRPLVERFSLACTELWPNVSSAVVKLTLRPAAIVSSVPQYRPNPALKRSTNGKPPGPVWRYTVHCRQPGPGVLPLAPA